MKQTLTKSKTLTQTDSSTKSNITADKVALTIMMMTSAIIGVWVVACLAVAIIASSGPLGLVTNWFKSVTGL